jgi:diacylglycerol kinase family enzyme
MSDSAAEGLPPLYIILNAGSGHDDKAATRATIEGVLAATGRRYTMVVVANPAELDASARRTVDEARRTGGIVVACGGDGTINTVAQATLGSGCAFGVLPQGTFNYFGRRHGIPANPEEAARILVTARPHPVQVGLVNDRVFLVNASLGLYPRLLEDREAWKHQLGRSRLVAMTAGLVSLFRHRRQLHIGVEERGVVHRIRTPTLFVGNNSLQLSEIGIPLADAVDAGEPHIVPAGRRSRDAVAAAAWRLRHTGRRRQRHELRLPHDDGAPPRAAAPALDQGRHRRRGHEAARAAGSRGPPQPLHLLGKPIRTDAAVQ